MAARDRFGGTRRAGGARAGPEPQTRTGGSPARPSRRPRRPGAGRPCRGAGASSGDCWSTASRRRARAAYRDAGHDTVIKPGPLRPAVPGGFTLDDFTVNQDAGTVTCPAGITRPMSRHPDRAPSARPAPAARCASRCTTAKDGRSMTIHPHERPAARRPRPGQDRRIQARLPHPVGASSGSSPGPPPATATDPAPLPRHRQEQRLAAHPVRRDQPAHPAPARTDPPRRRLGPGLTAAGPAPQAHPAQAPIAATTATRPGGTGFCSKPRCVHRSPVGTADYSIIVVQWRPRSSRLTRIVVLRRALGQTREHPAYPQIQARVREISGLKGPVLIPRPQRAVATGRTVSG